MFAAVLYGPARQVSRRELFLVSIALMLYGYAMRLHVESRAVITPTGVTLQYAYDRLQRDEPTSAEVETPLLDVSRCYLEVGVRGRRATLERHFLGSAASVEMRLHAPASSSLASTPLSDVDRRAIERLFHGFLPSARFTLASDFWPHPQVLGLGGYMERYQGVLPDAVRLAAPSRKPAPIGMVEIARAIGETWWNGPLFILLMSARWIGVGLFLASIVWLGSRSLKWSRLRRTESLVSNGRCAGCRYDLRTGGLARCPECGLDPAGTTSEIEHIATLLRR